MKPILALTPLAAAVIAAGCGSGSAPTSASSGAQTRSGSAMVATAHTRLGTVLVDARGRTLYLFAKDRGSSSSCYGSCASVWPPLLTDVDPAPGAGAHAARLGSSRRRDGIIRSSSPRRCPPPLNTLAAGMHERVRVR